MTVFVLHVAHLPTLYLWEFSPSAYGGARVSFWTNVCHPPPPPVASIWNKANLPFHQPGLRIDFWVVSSWTPHSFGNRIIWYLLFNVRFFSPSMFLRSSRVPACHRKACSFELQSPAPESVFAIPWRRTVRFLTLTDQVAMDIHVQLCLWPYIFIYLV